MAHIEVSIQLNATPEHVWSVVEPVENHVDWMADAVAIRFLNEQTRGVGTEFFCDTKVGPIKLVDKMEITEWIPQQVMGVRHVGVVTGTGKFTLTPHLGGTTFTWAEELKFPWWLGGKLGELVGAKLVMGMIWKRNLRELKKIVEANS
jgi:hypothetical protein